ncbi:hypothetical protein ARMGADRAFT_295852 [Armillaria gallica]|uniref:Uncharacterized protein n=1 Tax=Armillaria gallica TaxID=47427 RepID=A0A2H3D4Y2_ARMGA|nr:hypothetical protein ARMGADRAFT_295852 [Armillaria gallica]
MPSVPFAAIRGLLCLPRSIEGRLCVVHGCVAYIGVQSTNLLFTYSISFTIHRVPIEQSKRYGSHSSSSYGSLGYSPRQNHAHKYYGHRFFLTFPSTEQ